jgi:hypothetical protein
MTTAPGYSPADMPCHVSSFADVSSGQALQTVSGRPMFGPQLIELHSAAGAVVTINMDNGDDVLLTLAAGETRPFRGQIAGIDSDTTAATSMVAFWFCPSDTPLNP